jgi:hypothetical protein
MDGHIFVFILRSRQYAISKVPKCVNRSPQKRFSSAALSDSRRPCGEVHLVILKSSESPFNRPPKALHFFAELCALAPLR